ncbi:MAG: hypothetical protein L3J32_06445 [Rhizobiaceae bacterium]|nr:hypothetical protein [Rhizobiaceae bacterium]
MNLTMKYQSIRVGGSKRFRKLLNPKFAGVLFMLVLAGCVNSNNDATTALTSTQIESKQLTHEEKYVAGKCNSANRLQASNVASSALIAKYTAFSQNEAGMDAAKKETINSDLQDHSTNLQILDEDLTRQCQAYSACEFQASTNKQSCSIQKAKFAEAEKSIASYTKRVERLKVN